MMLCSCLEVGRSVFFLRTSFVLVLEVSVSGWSFIYLAWKWHRRGAFVVEQYFVSCAVEGWHFRPEPRLGCQGNLTQLSVTDIPGHGYS